MKIKALTSFTGAITMTTGDIRDVEDAVAKDLIAAGYAAKYEADKKGKKPEVKESVEIVSDNGDGTYKGVVDGEEATLRPADEETAEAAKEAVEGKKTSKAKK